jgi:hypothetical protein
MCYESAMKAFKNLMKDGHSGHSIQITKNILNRLIDGKPLTPIEDTDDVWGLVTDYPNGTKGYQCKRMSALFKDISPDGTVTYNDVERVVGIEVDNKSSWHSGLCDRVINEMFPIKMPYFPNNKPFEVYMKSVTEDEHGNVIETPGCFNTVYLYYAIKPDGERIELNRKFKENEQGKMVEVAIAVTLGEESEVQGNDL